MLFLENCWGLDDFCCSQESSIFHLDFTYWSIGSSSYFLDENVVFEIAFLLDFGKGVPLDWYFSERVFYPLKIIIILVIFAILTFISFGLSHVGFGGFNRLCFLYFLNWFRWLFYNRSFHFHLDSLLKHDGLDIEEVNFFWKVLLVVNFEFVSFLFGIMRLIDLWIDNDLWSLGFFCDDATIFYIPHCVIKFRNRIKM